MGSQSSHLASQQHLAEQEFDTWHRSTTMLKASWGLSHLETRDNLTTLIVKETFLANQWNSFHLLGKKLDHIHLKEFLKYEWEPYSKQP